MRTAPGLSLGKLSRNLLLASAVALSLPACQSALNSASARESSDSYYESLVAREAIKAAYGERSLLSGTTVTQIGSVHEIVPMDMAGPAPLGPPLAPADGPATNPDATSKYPQPNRNPSISQAAQIGRSSATLRGDEPVIGLSLQDVIARTVAHSLAIKVESYNPAIRESQVIETDASIFDPVFFGQSQWSVNDDPQTSPTLSNGQSWTNSFGIRKVLPIGTQIQASVGSNYRDLAVPNGALAPTTKSFWTSDVNFQFVQPLARGFGVDVNRANIYLAQRDLRISQSEFKQRVMTTVADVEEAYENLILARTNVETLQRLVVASEQTYTSVYDRIDIDSTVASVYQAWSALVSRRADLARAQSQYRTASDRLKTLINDPELDVVSNILINPTDRPLMEQINYDTLECIEIALRHRPEMQQARLQLEKADIVLKVAKNDLLPKVDLTLAVQTNGLDHGFDQSLSQTVDPFNNVDVTIGFKIEFPIGNRAAKAQEQRRLSERRQAITNMVNIAQQVVGNVKTQVREVYTSYEQIPMRDAVRDAASKEFQGIIDLENIRPHTPEFLQLKLDSLARLAQSEQQLITEIVNYNLAVMRLEQAKGTLLEFDRISLDKAPKPQKNDMLDILRYKGSTDLSKAPK